MGYYVLSAEYIVWVYGMDTFCGHTECGYIMGVLCPAPCPPPGLYSVGIYYEYGCMIDLYTMGTWVPVRGHI